MVGRHSGFEPLHNRARFLHDALDYLRGAHYLVDRPGALAAGYLAILDIAEGLSVILKAAFFDL